jgi:hypothetical protein
VVPRPLPVAALVVRRRYTNKHNSTSEVRRLGAQCLFVGPKLSRYVYFVLRSTIT